MLLIPYEQFTLKIPLTVEQVQQKLSEVIEPRKMLRISRDHTYFEGDFDDKQFKITRIIHYRNSFLPVINGEIRDELDKTAVFIRMRLNWFVVAFILIWTLTLIGMSIAILIGVITNEGLPWIMPALLIIIFYFLSIIFFHWEARKAKKYLQELLEKDEG